MGLLPVEQPQPFLKWVKSDSQADFLQIIQQSNGIIIGWIDAAGIRQGTLAGGGTGGTGIFPTPYEVVSFSGTSGTLAFTPDNNFGPLLFRNGVLMLLGGSGVIGYTISGTAIVLGLAASPSDIFQAVYSHD